MKTILVLASLFAASVSFAAATSTSQAPSTSILVGNTNGHSVYFSTNLASFAQSTANASVEFFLSDMISAGLNFASNSEKGSPVKKDGAFANQKVSVDRAAYGIGPTLWLRGSAAKTNLLVSPSIMYGYKKDAADVDSQQGLGVKISGLMRITKSLTGEAGLAANNLEDGAFRGAVYAGIGYLF